MQIVTKLPIENIKNYQLEMFDSGGRRKLPNTNCDQTTKWKYPKLPTRNVRFSGGGCKLPNANCDQITEWKYPKLPTSNVLGGGGVNYQMQIVTKLPNENIQNYQLEMIDSGRGGGKLPSANCDQTTKWKYPKLPTRNVWIWRGGGGKISKTTN